MKIIYENCGVKNYIKEDHRNYIDATSATAKKKPEKIQASTGFEHFPPPPPPPPRDTGAAPYQMS